MIFILYYFILPLFLYILDKKKYAIGIMIMKCSVISWITLFLFIYYVENLLNNQITNEYYITRFANEMSDIKSVVIQSETFGSMVFNLYVMVPFIVIQKATILLIEVDFPILFMWYGLISLLMIFLFSIGFNAFNNVLRSKVK